ncbi:MAG: hypothetical protein JNM16_02160 [Dechloromonas sp.]|nr:hypothetical protein [Dechloromonas sp.]
MSQTAQLAERIVVCHREPGYLRLELPAELCTTDLAADVEDGMKTLTGIASAALDIGWQRISIRYDAARLTTAQVARQLFDVLDALPSEPVTAKAGTAAMASGWELSDGIQPLLDKIKTLIIPAAPAPEGSLQARFQPMVESALTEKAITNFFNDIVAFYLIKVHWELITKRWLQNPVANSNAWLTTFYLVFLLVRYRKTK